MPLDRYMALANARYYATRDPLGTDGDFVTAPEISQMFGELIGLCLADLWDRAGRPADAIYVELGPGRGTLARDALRAMAAAGLKPAVHLVETSPVLRAAQARLLPGATWHDGLATLPGAPLLVVANEFFDALPIRQLVRDGAGWRERVVEHAGGERFRVLPGPVVPGPDVAGIRPGDVLEVSPAGLAVMAALARRLAAQGGAALVVDYGHVASGPGDTLQSVARHAAAQPFTAPGTRDLTAHVDFAALAVAAAAARTHGPVDQGAFLGALGLAQRAAALARGAPERAGEIAVAHRRLSHEEEMGRLFKVLGVTAPGWPVPSGF